ncbi:hypothetical protein CVT24_011225 [Panaeolus cyanescens]|uniref:Uncharacterized protein n=1 Tax=Panaeolus cyanescens TaxID=181874 RepID=A0A409YGE6_9AGAR|nr:hypothetical protein CVT24_011225 [Panaeolus cyanescens]
MRSLGPSYGMYIAEPITITQVIMIPSVDTQLPPDSADTGNTALTMIMSLQATSTSATFFTSPSPSPSPLFPAPTTSITTDFTAPLTTAELSKQLNRSESGVKALIALAVILLIVSLLVMTFAVCSVRNSLKSRPYDIERVRPFKDESIQSSPQQIHEISSQIKNDGDVGLQKNGHPRSSSDSSSTLREPGDSLVGNKGSDGSRTPVEATEKRAKEIALAAEAEAAQFLRPSSIRKARSRADRHQMVAPASDGSPPRYTQRIKGPREAIKKKSDTK